MKLRCPHCGGDLESLAIPRVTVDAILEWPGRRVLLIERRYEPHGWALPGGFVEAGESIEDACRREILEETGLTIRTLHPMHTYSDPRRDPRRHTITTVFVARADGVARAGDDAASVRVVSLDALPRPLCFDHEQILEDFCSGRWGIAPEGS